MTVVPSSPVAEVVRLWGLARTPRTLTSSATTMSCLTPNWEVLNDEIPNDERMTNDERSSAIATIGLFAVDDVEQRDEAASDRQAEGSTNGSGSYAYRS